MTDTAVKTPLSDLVASALDAMRRGGAMRVMDIPDDSSYSSHTFSGEVSQEISRRADLSAVPAQVRVKRGGSWLVVDDKAYDLRECTERAAKIVQDSGSNNIGFDMPPWFFTGSPYADQILALGVTPHAVPDGFITECIPDLGKVWISRQTIWETYIRTAEPQPDPRDEVIARLVDALADLRHNIGCAALVKNPAGIRVRAAADAALAAAKGVQHG